MAMTTPKSGNGVNVGQLNGGASRIYVEGCGEAYSGIEGATIRLLPPYIALVKIVKLPKPTKV